MVWLRAVLVGLGLATLQGAAAQGQHAVTGVQTGINRDSGQVPMRKNINVLAAQGGPEWDLYIQATAELQALADSDPMSYFQIAGIHGQPYIPWDGDSSGNDGSDWLGYCPHNEHKFMSWHRPYLALYEQALVAKAQQIALRYSDNEIQRYQAAANNLRIPFWDWATDASMPSVVANPTVRIGVFPNNTLTDVPNPLFDYDYPLAVEQGRYGAYDGGDRTFRCSSREANGALATSGLASQVYNVFVRATDYQTMASQQSSGSSFESPHNTVHMRTSCGGDMSNPNVAAFDPIFMMHHANIDRLFAMWQAIYFQEPISFRGQGYGQLGTARSSSTGPEDPLKPFAQGSGGYHTSSTIVRTSDFGYTYPELPFWNMTAEELSQDVKAAVNSMYGGGQNALQRRDESERKNQYFAQLKVNRTMVPLPCEIKVYVEGEMAGSITLLSIPEKGFSYGEVPLRMKDECGPGRGLPGYVAPPSGDATDYFKKNLRVQVADCNGTIVAVPNNAICIDVEGTEREPARNGYEFPRFVNRWKIVKIGKIVSMFS